MADVYAARDSGLHRDVAIKFFRQPDIEQTGHASSPGLVTVYDACFDDLRRPRLIQRLIDGGTLRQRISHEGPLEPEHVARVGIRLATALAPFTPAGSCTGTSNRPTCRSIRPASTTWSTSASRGHWAPSA